ncbi:MAG: hypothetical protein ACLUP5_03160 [Streptococcus sp.]
MATLKRPELLLLDEHTAALDPKTSVALMELTDEFVTGDHSTALMITHHMEDALKIRKSSNCNEWMVKSSKTSKRKKKVSWISQDYYAIVRVGLS